MIKEQTQKDNIMVFFKFIISMCYCLFLLDFKNIFILFLVKCKKDFGLFCTDCRNHVLEDFHFYTPTQL